jgi:hypothetical protein
MGHSAEFGVNAMATLLDLFTVCVMGHSVGPNITTQYDTKILLKLAMSLKRDSNAKKCMYHQCLYFPSFKFLVSAKKGLVPRCGP